MKYKSAILLVLIVAFLVFMSGLILSHSDGRNNINKNKQTGELIVNALNTYQQEHGTFPQVLDELVPAYINKVPTTMGGHNFFYRSDSVDGFILSFMVESRLGCGYTDKFKTWECSYGD
jgi:hypothetical protein